LVGYYLEILFLDNGNQTTMLAMKKRGVSKYGDKGPYSSKSFNKKNIPLDLKEIIASTANHAVTQKSWGSYKTANNLLQLCQKETKYNLSLPLSEEKTLIFISWCIKRGNKGSTIKVYLAGLRSLHIEKGFSLVDLYTPMVKQVIKGRENMPISSSTNQRLPCTLSILRLLKSKLRTSKLLINVQLLIWCIATLSFFGAFRIGELLCKNTTKFDPDFTLTKRDLCITETKEIDFTI
jgi:hypothetical protein